MPSPKRLLIFCDGTWVGRETALLNAPPSNILLLASTLGSINYDPSRPSSSTATLVHPITTHDPSVTAGYQEGVGLNSTFLSYIWDGATGSSINLECVSVYAFIAQHFTAAHEVWLFGFSRGAYTVRCVAGMINNCGIIRTAGLSSEDVDTLCKEVYRTYRSPLPADHPTSSRCVALRGDPARVWQVRCPIRFMGLIDTVGALGIPRLSAGTGLAFPTSDVEFFDQKVSLVVRTVYHAVALHDRMWAFQPCLAFAAAEGEAASSTVEIRQKWFPGCHYDLGRQTFRFVRARPWNVLEAVLGVLPAAMSKTVWPNEVLADCVLRWLLEGVRRVEAEDANAAPLIRDLDTRIAELGRRIAFPEPRSVGTGDVYGDLFSYAPWGRLYDPIKQLLGLPFLLLNHVFPRLGENVSDLLGVKTLLGLLTATMDRRVVGGDADVYAYKAAEHVRVHGMEREFTVAETARIERYPSKSFETWGLWKRVFGV